MSEVEGSGFHYIVLTFILHLSLWCICRWMEFVFVGSVLLSIEIMWNIIVFTIHHDADVNDSASMRKNKNVIKCH